MNNEVKEILAYFEEYVKIIDMHDSEPMLNWKDLKIVLDYITNLQKENIELKIKLEDKAFPELLAQVETYKLRIDKAIGELYYLESNCDITELGSIKLKQILKGEE